MSVPDCKGASVDIVPVESLGVGLFSEAGERRLILILVEVCSVIHQHTERVSDILDARGAVLRGENDKVVLE